MFYENFERICRAKGISPSAAGLAIGTSKSTPSAWKKNGTIPKEKELEELAKLLKCQVSDFFTSKEHTEAEKQAFSFDGLAVDENVVDFISIYNECSNRQKVQLMNFVYDFEDKVLSAGEEA